MTQDAARSRLQGFVSPPVPAEEVAEILRKIGDGEITPRIAEGHPGWQELFSGNVHFDAGGWRIVVFVDCDDWDYVDSVFSPDGRIGKFEDWCAPVDEPDHQRCQPDELLFRQDRECHHRMEMAFRSLG
jgi:hypothetical protein